MLFAATNTDVVKALAEQGAKGQLLDSTMEREPLAFIQGMGNLISGLEKALEGKKTGDIPESNSFSGILGRLFFPLALSEIYNFFF